MADMFSRNPSSMKGPEDVPRHHQLKARVQTRSTRTREDAPLDRLAKEASGEESYMRILKALKEGWKVDKLPFVHPARELASQWANISVETFSEAELAVIEGTKILIPVAAQKRLIDEINATCMSGEQMWCTVKGIW